ncbi:hypothetical protein MFLO_04235 [Listeria floridensis FSL S10-1187]|uniref:Restriction endonuclease type IV Mrr domain-containing protein n=1 Tax=Listeria floridensis FSL S10-1187 TaxID=1265817 RepID=A0ABN0RGU1_9LIST|nr:restriction endonuclease [Listeria floridensis]EUJ33120.1 hypothetical protein MFLO_04235 [Listeria floridensis FSL S10-1187]
MNKILKTLFNKNKNTFEFDEEDINIFLNPPTKKDPPSNKRFTNLIERIYTSQGFSCEIVEGINDCGADIIARKDNKVTAIQIKHHNPLSKSKNIGESVLNKLLQAKKNI